MRTKAVRVRIGVTERSWRSQRHQRNMEKKGRELLVTECATRQRAQLALRRRGAQLERYTRALVIAGRATAKRKKRPRNTIWQWISNLVREASTNRRRPTKSAQTSDRAARARAQCILDVNRSRSTSRAAAGLPLLCVAAGHCKAAAVYC